MELILVRHAKAFERDASAWPDDSRRPLTEAGREQFVRLAKKLRLIRPEVDLVESSGFARAWQTALLLEEHARWPRPARLERLEVRDDAEGALLQLEALARTVVAIRAIPVVAWVGHEPSLSRFASLLLAGDPNSISIDFRKGGAVSLWIDPESRASQPARAKLRWMLTPGIVRRMSK